MSRPDNPASEDTAETVLVTGAAGFIGSHLCEALLSAGHAVVGVDNFDPFYDARLKRRNIEAVRAQPRGGAFSFVEADIRDAGSLAPVFDSARPTGVIHLAARAGVRPSIADPVGYAQTNVVGTASVLAEAQRAGCRRLLFASSSSVYGDSPKVPFSESDDVSAPISPYASTKAAGELLCRTHHHLTGMPTACLRFFTVYGPRQRPDLAISLFLRRIAAGEPITLFGEGTSRDYTFVADTVAGILAAYGRIDRFGFRIWNLGNSEPVALEDMVGMAAAAVGRAPVVHRAPGQAGDVKRTWADPTRSEAELGYRPATKFEQGLAAQWAWLRAQPAD
jgi:UDP-glucuronate 4-epimerase